VLSVDGAQAATGRIEHTVGIRYTLNVESFDIGEDTGTAVDTSYSVPFPFGGAIRKVTIDLKTQDKASAEAAKQAERKLAAEMLKRQ
jgi:arylsulfatase